MVCASVHFPGTFGSSTNFLCTRQFLPAGFHGRSCPICTDQVFPSVFGEETIDPIQCSLCDFASENLCECRPPVDTACTSNCCLAGRVQRARTSALLDKHAALAKGRNGRNPDQGQVQSDRDRRGARAVYALLRHAHQSGARDPGRGLRLQPRPLLRFHSRVSEQAGIVGTIEVQ